MMWILAFIFFLMDVAQHHGDSGEMIRFAAERAGYYVVSIVVLNVALSLFYPILQKMLDRMGLAG